MLNFKKFDFGISRFFEGLEIQLTHLYPKWVATDLYFGAPLNDLTPWRRDLVSLYTFWMDTADGSMVLLSVVKDDVAIWCWFHGGHHKKGIYSEVLHSMKCQQTRNCGGYKKNHGGHNKNQV